MAGDRSVARERLAVNYDRGSGWRYLHCFDVHRARLWQTLISLGVVAAFALIVAVTITAILTA